MFSRYENQEIFFGKNNQMRFRKTKIAIVGIGALGCVCADLLARAGIGTLILIDEDKVELKNLNRQTLFSEKDVGKEKTKAAKKRLKEINSEINIKQYPERLTPSNIENFLKLADIIVDCTDNLRTKFMLNDYAKKRNIVLIHGAAIKDIGTLFVVDEKTCLRCIYEKTNNLDSCEEVGVVNTITNLVGTLLANECIKIISKGTHEKNLLRINLNNEIEKIRVKQKKLCPACNGVYEFLEKNEKEIFEVRLCKTKAAYSTRLKKNKSLNLKKISNKFNTINETPLAIIIEIEGHQIIVHKYGDLVFKNLKDIEKIKKIAKSVYSVGLD